jgi:heme exporter protein B
VSDFIHLLRHDLRLHARQLGEWAALVLFFIIVILLLPFTLGPEPDLLKRLAPGLIWLAALLMSLLALDKLFVADARDGTLDVMLLSPLPLPVIVFSKLLAQAFMMLTVLGVMLLPAALLLGMSPAVLPVLIASLLLGIPSLVLIGGIAGAITVSLHRGAALLTLLLAPFYIPILIFAVSACDAAALGASAAPPLLLLGAILCLLLPTAPFIIAAALRHGQD